MLPGHLWQCQQQRIVSGFTQTRQTLSFPRLFKVATPSSSRHPNIRSVHQHRLIANSRSHSLTMVLLSLSTTTGRSKLNFRTSMESSPPQVNIVLWESINGFSRMSIVSIECSHSSELRFRQSPSWSAYPSTQTRSFYLPMSQKRLLPTHHKTSPSSETAAAMPPARLR